MTATGARLVRGEGRLTDERTVAVDGEQLVARRAVVVANGGPPRSQASPASTRRVLDQSAGGGAEGVPVSLAILGGGAIGVELAKLSRGSDPG